MKKIFGRTWREGAAWGAGGPGRTGRGGLLRPASSGLRVSACAGMGGLARRGAAGPPVIGNGILKGSRGGTDSRKSEEKGEAWRPPGAGLSA